MKKNKYCASLNDLLEIFAENISASDIIAAKLLGVISATIVKYRIELGMTQKQFAEYMGVSQGMVSKWESKDYNFSIKSLSDIASKLDLDIDVRLYKSKIVQMPETINEMNYVVERSYVIDNNNNSNTGLTGCKFYIENLDLIKEDKKCYSM